VCERELNLQQLGRINGVINEDVRQIATERRDAAGRPAVEMGQNIILCINCQTSVQNEIRILENDPNCLRLNVLTQTRNGHCFVCNAANEIVRLPRKSCVNKFIATNIFVPDYVRSCNEHLDAAGNVLPEYMPDRFINRPYAIEGTEMLRILQDLRQAAHKAPKSRFEGETDVIEEVFQVLYPVSKEQFLELFSHCDPDPEDHPKGVFHRHVTKKDLLAFLCKLRHGVTDAFYSFFTSPYLPPLLEVERTSIAVNADDVR